MRQQNPSWAWMTFFLVWIWMWDASFFKSLLLWFSVIWNQSQDKLFTLSWFSCLVDRISYHIKLQWGLHRWLSSKDTQCFYKGPMLNSQNSHLADHTCLQLLNSSFRETSNTSGLHRTCTYLHATTPPHIHIFKIFSLKYGNEKRTEIGTENGDIAVLNLIMWFLNFGNRFWKEMWKTLELGLEKHEGREQSALVCPMGVWKLRTLRNMRIVMPGSKRFREQWVY